MDFLGALSPVNIQFLLQGFLITIEVALISIALSFVISVLVGTVRYAKVPVLGKLFAVLVEMIRNLPLLLIIFFTYFALPQLGIKLDKFTAAVIALVIFESAMISEIVRGGLNSVEKGLIEAGRSSGLTQVQTLRHIVLPIALRRMVPPMVSQFISLLKDTSLAVVIALPELMNHVNIINGQNVNYVIPTFVFAALLYFVVNYVLSIASLKLESRRS
ncbi:amino acid ABC transporter permease [Paenibacillus thiaminolyticus]|uniref:Amino acid ABC transporter permease n=1 Tax=Paenibacillus thiaminolyticus TaxID=49283 RepID=A0AAP9DV06_PANTH|nr:amino acid ABC transporter permease [Paenibacillus thiaminolyticus]MCY9537756.1 amino acid ABC transporter permease [Paenibacillus thiaminolyticus]MCY9600313.1 amino acid ABC transporter permease [Paenibacillus thiaminolyticus]MCY9607357.1 amino acid ABC transporter permease [Paenibacillus thiaminolyticus]MCY9613900.1 amino acid ABC transporter permease [Paenibacillus thiaminolyticus]MCY9617905.1 amino acid ABC transporter permease [Paenibacillus thiaminolyticus]